MKSFERKIFPYLMLAPTLLVFGVFLFYPALNGVWISLTKWDGVNPQKFIGFQNYLKLAADKNFWESFANTLLFTAFSVPLIYAAALGLAVLLTGEIKGSNFFRAVLVNYLLTLMEKSPVKWLTDARNAMMVIILVTVWSMAGYYMVMFVSGIKGISQTYYEAARIDGGGAWQQFWYITLPLLKPTSLLVIVLSTINVIKTYPLVFALTQGGPAGATKFMVQTIQETGFEKSQMGYASAMTMVLFLVLSMFTSVQFKVNRGGEQDVE